MLQRPGNEPAPVSRRRADSTEKHALLLMPGKDEMVEVHRWNTALKRRPQKSEPERSMLARGGRGQLCAHEEKRNQQEHLKMAMSSSRNGTGPLRTCHESMTNARSKRPSTETTHCHSPLSGSVLDVAGTVPPPGPSSIGSIRGPHKHAD